LFYSPMKIFCIGYPRTGTTSLISALGKLGFKGWHYNRNFYSEAVRALKIGQFSEKLLEHNTAFADVPIFYIYKNLDKLYPSSKFILVTREKQSWFESMQWLMNHKNRRLYPDEHNQFLWGNLYPEMIEEHTEDVKQYFLGSDRLLVRDLSEMNFDTLVYFLNIQPKQPLKGFPRENARG